MKKKFILILGIFTFFFGTITTKTQADTTEEALTTHTVKISQKTESNSSFEDSNSLIGNYQIDVETQDFYNYLDNNLNKENTIIKTIDTMTNSSENSSNDSIVDACTNPDILKVIYFVKLIINIVKIVVPIGLVIIGMIDFSKSVATSNEEVQKKNVSLFVKRIICAVLVFAVPWIVETLIVSLGNLTEGVNFTDCLENANEDKIKALEEKAASSSNNSSNNNGNNSSGNNNNNNNNSNSNSNGNNNSGNTQSKKDTIIYVGDSRTEGMCQSVKMSSSEICISKVGMGYSWLAGEAKNKLRDTLNKYPNSYVVINMGTNDLYNTGGKYPEFYNNLAKNYPTAKIVVMSVTQIDDALASSHGYKVKNSDVYNFNEKLKQGLSNDIVYCDVYSKIAGNFKTTDGIHYTATTYNLIYNKIKECLN